MWDQYKWSYTVSQLILGPGGLLIEISDRVNHLFVTLSNYEFFLNMNLNSQMAIEKIIINFLEYLFQIRKKQ